jgi:hypothetical protein
MSNPARRRPVYVPTALSGPVVLPVGTRLYNVPASAAVRYQRTERSVLAWVFANGTIHLLSPQGEMLLSPPERDRMKAAWPLLVMGDARGGLKNSRGSLSG